MDEFFPRRISGASLVSSRGGRRPRRSLAAAAGRIAGELIPFDRTALGVDRLIVIPDGILHRLPFEALRTADGRAFLVERYAISYAPFRFGPSLDRSEEEPGGSCLLAMGASVPDRPAGTGGADAVFEEMPGVREEIRSVSRFFDRNRRFTDGAWRGDSGGGVTVHIAGHGTTRGVRRFFFAEAPGTTACCGPRRRGLWVWPPISLSCPDAGPRAATLRPKRGLAPGFPGRRGPIRRGYSLGGAGPIDGGLHEGVLPSLGSRAGQVPGVAGGEAGDDPRRPAASLLLGRIYPPGRAGGDDSFQLTRLRGRKERARRGRRAAERIGRRLRPRPLKPGGERAGFLPSHASGRSLERRGRRSWTGPVDPRCMRSCFPPFLPGKTPTGSGKPPGILVFPSPGWLTFLPFGRHSACPKPSKPAVRAAVLGVRLLDGVLEDLDRPLFPPLPPA